MSILEKAERKALVKLFSKDEKTDEVVELGFAAKVKQNKDEQKAALITSSCVFSRITNGNKVVLQEYSHRFKFPCFPKFFKTQDALKNVAGFEHNETMDACWGTFDGCCKESNFLYYEFLSEEQKNEITNLSAYVFEDNEIIELQFQKQGGSYKIDSVSKEGFDVKRARGAPVICQTEPNKKRVVGVIGSHERDDTVQDFILHPMLFGEEDQDTPQTREDSTAGDQDTPQTREDPTVKDQHPLQTGDESTVGDQLTPQTREDPTAEDQDTPQTREDTTAEDQDTPQTREVPTVKDQHLLQTGDKSTVGDQLTPQTREDPTVKDQHPLQTREDPTVKDQHPLQTKEDSNVKDQHPLQTREDPTVKDQNPLQTRDESTVGDQLTPQTREDPTVQDQHPLQTREDLTPQTRQDPTLVNQHTLQTPEDSTEGDKHTPHARGDPTVEGQLILKTPEDNKEKEQVALQRRQDDSVSRVPLGDVGVAHIIYNVAVKDNAQVAIGNNSQASMCSDKDAERVAQNFETKIEDYTKKLQSSILKQTDLQQGLRQDKKIRTDDIFTNVTIQRGQKQWSKPRELMENFGGHLEDTKENMFYCTNRPRLSSAPEPRRPPRYEEQGNQSSVLLNRCSEIFTCPMSRDKVPQTEASSITNPNPKFILLFGKAGIGKTLFCQKLVRDWADGMLFDGEKAAKIPDFQFVLLLTFRQLNLKENEELDLCQLLNCSSVLNEQFAIDAALMEYIIKYPERLLIIIDGFDEYSSRDKITGDFETKYPNNPCQKMPVPAMLAKLLKGKILKDSVVMVTSRPEAIEEIEEMIFDVTVEILGFSPRQVMEYVGAFFKDNQRMKDAVLGHLGRNKSLVSFGHIPFMCFLMCYYLEWNMAQPKGNIPLSLSDLFHEVIKVFLEKHHALSKYAKMKSHKLEETLLKLAGLAANLMREQKFIFAEEDMKKSNLTDEEIENLKASGLLDCCPGVKKSPFDKVRPEYTFTHFTMQEFLTAYCFVTNKQAPEKNTTGMTLVFMAGLLSREKDEERMHCVLELVKPSNEHNELAKLQTLQCLFEYNDEELSKRVILSLSDKYCTFGKMQFSRLADADIHSISYLFNIINVLNTERSLEETQIASTERRTRSDQKLQLEAIKVTELWITNSVLSASGVKLLCSALIRNMRSIKKLGLVYCQIDDDCIVFINELLLASKIARLDLKGNLISDKGLEMIVESITSDRCSVEWVILDHNWKITDGCKERQRRLVPELKPGVRLIIFNFLNSFRSKPMAVSHNHSVRPKSMFCTVSHFDI